MASDWLRSGLTLITFCQGIDFHAIMTTQPAHEVLQMLKAIRLLLIVVMVLALSGRAGLSFGAPNPPYQVGYRVLDLHYQNASGPQTITVAAWYPTSSTPATYQYGGPTTGLVAKDGVPFTKDGPYPLLVFSHGYGGSGLSNVFFTGQLAAHGWIVVAPDHHDRHSFLRIRTGRQDNAFSMDTLKYIKNMANSSPADRPKFLYRLDEIQGVLDAVIESPEFSGLIDKERVAVGGHSLGGFTALGVCGTIEARRDPRVKAVLLFSTGAGGYLYTKEELHRVKAPSMLFLGEKEMEKKRGDKTMLEISQKIFSNLYPPKYFLTVKGASHFSFNDHFDDNAVARMLSGTEEEFGVIRRYSTAFLEKYVAGRPDADRQLERTDPRLTLFDSVLDALP